MARSKFYFLEASKVRTYHLTLIEGYLTALLASPIIAASYDIIFQGHSSLWQNISRSVRTRLTYCPLPVIDQDKHHVVRKSLLEFWVVLRAILKLTRGDVLFVSCMMPTALLLVEVACRFLPKRNIFVVIHGEIEEAFAGEHPHWRTIGYWTIRWLGARRKNSQIRIVVIDDFVKTNLIARFPDKFGEASLFVAHHPITATALVTASASDDPIACFIGYRSPAKGFREFQNMAAAAHPAVHFIAIGGGKVEDVRSAKSCSISTTEEFHRAIAGSSVALFPYLRAYDCSLSAAVLDALSTGVHVVASPRRSFVSLQEVLGPDVITICHTPAEFDALLAQHDRLISLRKGQNARLENLANSKFGPKGIQSDFERICESIH